MEFKAPFRLNVFRGDSTFFVWVICTSLDWSGDTFISLYLGVKLGCGVVSGRLVQYSPPGGGRWVQYFPTRWWEVGTVLPSPHRAVGGTVPIPHQAGGILYLLPTPQRCLSLFLFHVKNKEP